MPILGHGIDLVDIARLARTLEDHDERFLERCYTRAEQIYCDAGQKRRLERLAGRFAAKEAVLKALGTGLRHGITWTQIETVPDNAGAPTLQLSDQALSFADDLGITRWWLSISHTENHAMASAIAWGPGFPPENVET